MSPASTLLPSDGVAPSPTGAKRMLEAYAAAALPGSTNEEARKFARSAVAFTDSLQHRRSARRADAEPAFAGVESVARIVEILSGQASPSREPGQGVEVQGRYFAWSGPTLHATRRSIAHTDSGGSPERAAGSRDDTQLWHARSLESSPCARRVPTV